MCERLAQHGCSKPTRRQLSAGPCYSRSERMGLLACRGPVHAPSLVWGAGGGAVVPPSPASPRPPCGRRPQSSNAACPQRSCYDVTYDLTRSPVSGGTIASKRHAAVSGVSPAPPAQHHRLKVVSGESHFRSEKHEILQGPHAAGGDSSLYTPVYFTLPGVPAQGRGGTGGMDKWDSARVLHRSRPVAAVLRHIEEQRSPHSPGERKTRYVPLFDANGRLMPAAPLAPLRVPDSHRASGRGTITTGKDAGGNAPLARKAGRSSSSYMYCISNNLGMDRSCRSKPTEDSGSFWAPLSAPALIGYKPVYIGAGSSGSTWEHTISRSYDRGHSRQPNFGPNHSAFLVSCSGREGRSYRTVAGSRSCGYGGASGRAHCRALYSSQTGYTLGWVRRRNADEHAAAAKIQARFRGRKVRVTLSVLNAFARDIQRRVRGRIFRSARKQEMCAATRIQAWYQGWLVRSRDGYGAVLTRMRNHRLERARRIKNMVFHISTLKPAAKKLVAKMRERKQALHSELRRYVSLRKFRRYAARALTQSREDAKEAKRVAKQQEWDALDDQDQINQLLRDDTNGKISLHERPNDEGWTLKWGNMLLSKQKVAELAAEVERVTAEWRGGKIVRGDDGVFRACFDPGNLYADWLSKWCDPTHYSHAGRYPYPKPTVRQQHQQQWHLQHVDGDRNVGVGKDDTTRRLSDDTLSTNQYGDCDNDEAEAEPEPGMQQEQLGQPAHDAPDHETAAFLIPTATVDDSTLPDDDDCDGDDHDWEQNASGSSLVPHLAVFHAAPASALLTEGVSAAEETDRQLSTEPTDANALAL